jgi:hypothetical protein
MLRGCGRPRGNHKDEPGVQMAVEEALYDPLYIYPAQHQRLYRLPTRASEKKKPCSPYTRISGVLYPLHKSLWRSHDVRLSSAS